MEVKQRELLYEEKGAPWGQIAPFQKQNSLLLVFIGQLNFLLTNRTDLGVEFGWKKCA